MYCNKCGAQIPDDSDFCPKCGHKVAGVISSPNSSQKSTKESNNKSNSLGKKIAAIVGAAVIVCLVLALLGVFDKPVEKLGENEIFKGNDTKSAFSDTTGSQPSNQKYEVDANLLNYFAKTEDEVIDILGFNKNDYHMYPGYNEKDANDYCIMFYFDDNGKLSEVMIDSKSYALYPDANIEGIKYDMPRENVQKVLEAKGYSFLSEIDDGSAKLLSYYNDDFRSITVKYENNKAVMIAYSDEDKSEVIKEILAEQAPSNDINEGDMDYSLWSGSYYDESGFDLYLEVIIYSDTSSAAEECGSIEQNFRGNIVVSSLYHVGGVGSTFYWDLDDGYYVYPYQEDGKLKLRIVSVDETTYDAVFIKDDI